MFKKPATHISANKLSPDSVNTQTH